MNFVDTTYGIRVYYVIDIMHTIVTFSPVIALRIIGTSVSKFD